MKPKSGKRGGKSAPEAAAPSGDMLVDAARAIGSALGTLAAKAKTLPDEIKKRAGQFQRGTKPRPRSRSRKRAAPKKKPTRKRA